MENKEFLIRVLSLLAITAMVCAYLIGATQDAPHQAEMEKLVAECNSKIAACNSAHPSLWVFNASGGNSSYSSYQLPAARSG